VSKTVSSYFDTKSSYVTVSGMLTSLGEKLLNGSLTHHALSHQTIDRVWVIVVSDIDSLRTYPARPMPVLRLV
jgi:hypothetical protein